MTTDAGIRGGKPVPLKANVDKAVAIAATKNEHVKKVFVTHRAGAGVGPGAPGWVEGRDFDLDSAKAAASPVCVPEVMDAEDPLFLLYTSGSTGAPKVRGSRSKETESKTEDRGLNQSRRRHRPLVGSTR